MTDFADGCPLHTAARRSRTGGGTSNGSTTAMSLHGISSSCRNRDAVAAAIAAASAADLGTNGHRRRRRGARRGFRALATTPSATASASAHSLPRSRSMSRSMSMSTSTSLLLLLLAMLRHHTHVAEAFTVERKPNVNDAHRIVFGTAALSKVDDPYAILDAAYAKGFRRFDLAHTYGGGESERIFGRWLDGAGSLPNVDRSELRIITKGGIGNDAFGDPNRPLLSRDGLYAEVQESLASLRIDTIDLYMYHRDDLRLPVSSLVDWMNDVMQTTGAIRRWGVSNWTYQRFRDADAYARANGLVGPSANSPQFSLAVPDGEIWPSTYSISGPEFDEEIDWYEIRGVELLCWEVLAKGFMAKADLWPEDQIDPSTFIKPVTRGSDEWRLQRLQRAYCNPENYRRRRLAMQLADLCGCKLAQIAMLYPLTRGRHISVIFGSSDSRHLDDMAALRHMNIDDEAMDMLVGRSVESKRVRWGGQADVAAAAAAFVPRLLGLGRNNVLGTVRLSSSAKEVAKEEIMKQVERMDANNKKTDDGEERFSSHVAVEGGAKAPMAFRAAAASAATRTSKQTF